MAHPIENKPSARTKKAVSAKGKFKRWDPFASRLSDRKSKSADNEGVGFELSLVDTTTGFEEVEKADLMSGSIFRKGRHLVAMSLDWDFSSIVFIFGLCIGQHYR